jgi:uncharacterized repeat protein (TIGR02543 family)
VVAVAIDDFIIFNGDVATVKFNNVVMHAAPNSHSVSPGLRILKTQIFYLTGDELPPAGSYEVSVSFTRKVDVAAGGAVSLFGVQPGAPVAAATNVKPLSLGPIRTTINAPADSWVVDLVASEIDASPTPGPGQIKRFSAARNLFGIAGSAQAATTPGPTTLVWNNGLSRLVTSAVAFAARPEFRLTLATNGSGTIQSDPAGDKFPAGTRVTLTATPAPGWRFEGWSGDLTGTDNPAIITMDREKSITANFTPLPPSITTQPLSQTVTTGSNVTFSVRVNGEPPLTYQTLTLQNTGSGVNVSYTLRDAATGNVVMTYSATQAAASFTQFDTVAFYLSKASGSANYNFIIEAVDVSLSGGSPGDPPVITTQPASQTVSAGANVTFTVGADGSAPLSYQWLKNGAAMAGATAAGLTLTNVQAADAGAYRVVVSNAAGSATSATAVLTVETGPVAPSITSQPASQIVVVGGQAGFTVIATGTAPLSYQWSKNGSPIAGATAATLNLTNVQQSDSGDYSVTVSNSVGTATSGTATLTVSDAPPTALYDLAGFARAATGGGLPPESDPNYRKVFTADDLVAALGNRNTKVIEIMNDLDLGFNEVPATAGAGALRSASAPLLHPALLTTGVSLIDIQDKNGLTIFSANGATIRHATFNVKRANNVIIRNLKFDELWEWDESSKGKYDKQGWDFITVDMTSDNIWIDHCTFTKAYDGVIDIKGGTRNVTISWCSFLGDDGGPGSFVRRQIEALDQNRPAYPMYDFLRSNGFSVEDIIAISRSQKKGSLVGANELDPANANHQVTLHHNYYLNMQDRAPRLRAGNAHAYDIYVNNAEAFAAKGLRDAIVAAMTPSNAAKLNGGNATYSFDVVLNGAISTEGGAVLLEKSQLIGVIFPLRNNQKDASLTQYTGKILALDTLYQLGGLVFRGDSNTPDSPLAPVPAPELAFSWNGFATLPYVYTTHDPTQLPLLLTGAEGAGAGRLIWTKENWLKTSY